MKVNRQLWIVGGFLLFFFCLALLIRKVHEYDPRYPNSPFRVGVRAQHQQQGRNPNAVSTSLNPITKSKIGSLRRPTANGTRESRLPVLWVVVTPGGLPVLKLAADDSASVATLLDGVFFASSSSQPFNGFVQSTFPYPGWVRVFDADRGFLAKKAAFALSPGPNGSVSAEHGIESDQSTIACTAKKFRIDVDFKGRDLPRGNMAAGSVEECCQHCFQRSNCLAFTFTPDNMCWLKGKVAESDLSAKDGLISGTLDSYPNGKRIHLPVAPTPDEANSLEVTQQCCTLDLSHETAKSMSVDRLDEVEIVTPDGPSSANFSRTFVLEKQHLDPPSAPFLLKLRRRSIDWTEQWPIGNGLIGALVGGTLEDEVIPISVGNFFVSKPAAAEAVRRRLKAEEFNPKTSIFLAARKLLQDGKVQEAQDSMGNLQEPGLGGFEYVADLSIHSSPVPIRCKEVDQLKEGALGRPSPPLPVFPGRQGVLKMLKDGIAKEPTSTGRTTFGNILKSFSILDTKHATAYSSYVEAIDSSTSTKSSVPMVRLHQRDWFASHIDDVVVGTMVSTVATADPMEDPTLVSPSDSQGDGTNYVVRLSRESSAPREEGGLGVSINVQRDDSRYYALLSNGTDKAFDAAFSLEIIIKPENGWEAPVVALCGWFMCSRQGNSSSVAVDAEVLAVSDGFHCNNINNLNAIFSAALSEGDASTRLEKRLKDVRKNCWEKVDAAVGIGVVELRRRHQNEFAAKMEAVELSLSTMNSTQSCPATDLPSRVTSFGRGCLRPHSENAEVIGTEQLQENQMRVNEATDLGLIMQVFQFGRYLMLSSATKSSVANLQGIWTDGPTSSWNGDYHMNINMQQMYWSVDAARLESAFPPFVSFLRQLSKNGEATAAEIYGIAQKGGWVSHGFTDNRLKTGPMGSPQWAMCVTCGAWLVMHLWEHLLYEFDEEFLRNDVIPILRGVVTFFKAYLWRDESGVWHTGPTTSPENSYYILRNLSGFPAPHLKMGSQHNAASIEAFFLAFSPAFDIAVLRQIANMYLLSLEWAIGLADDKSELSDERNSAVKFIDQIRGMPNHGLPTVSEDQPVLLEYPDPLPTQRTSRIEAAGTNGIPIHGGVVLEGLDRGHRHFSPLLWLFPGMFHPGESQSSDQAWQGSLEFLRGKIDDGGGHTSWSAAWEAALWARFRRPEEAMTALRRLLNHFTTGNLLSLHPPLIKKGLDTSGVKASRQRVSIRGECETCFAESPVAKRRKSGASLIAERSTRGMVTNDDYKFQLDGNLGFVSAVLEMIVQTHVPGSIFLLPALPKELSDFGRLRGVRCRGDAVASIAWQKGAVEALQLDLLPRRKRGRGDEVSFHPWWGEYSEMFHDGSGFFTFTASATTATSSTPLTTILLAIYSPNNLRVLQSNRYCSVKAMSTRTRRSYRMDRNWLKNSMGGLLAVTQIEVSLKRDELADGGSCQFVLCAMDVEPQDCLIRVQ